VKSLRYKIGFSYLGLLVLGLATSVFAIYNFSQLRSSVTAIMHDTYQATTIAENLVKALDDQENAQLSAVIDEHELYHAYFNDGRDRFLNWYEQAPGSTLTNYQAAVLDSILITYRLYLTKSNNVFDLLAKKNKYNIAKRYEKYVVRPIAERLKLQCFQILEANQATMAQTEKNVESIALNSTFLMIITLIVSLVLSIFISYNFTRTIIKPAEKLTQSVRKIGQGHLAQKIDVNTDDEIGELSSEFNKMTERLRSYEQMNIHQLIAEKKKSETIVENIVDPIIVTDRQGALMLMNQAAAAVFDVHGPDWLGKPLRTVIGNQSWAEMLELNGVQRYEEEKRDQLFAFVRNNATLYFRPRQAQIVDDQGNVQGVVTLLQDVTRFKDLDRMKSEFIATVSHELRTPLTSLSMGIDILSQGVVGAVNQHQKELLVAAKDDSERLRKLVKDLLDLSKLESGKYEMKKEFVDFRRLVAEAVRPLRLPFEEKQIQLEFDVPERFPALFADPHQLIWVVTNLLSNALRFTDPGGSVHLTAKEEKDKLLVTVSDTGHGIPREHQETVFEKFVQVKSPTETTPGSVGLGLAIAREVVESHGGRIWLESTVGVGSTFFFTLPIGSQSET
jgi:PAS domain S-box-containing protein